MNRLERIGELVEQLQLALDEGYEVWFYANSGNATPIRVPVLALSIVVPAERYFFWIDQEALPDALCQLSVITRTSEAQTFSAGDWRDTAVKAMPSVTVGMSKIHIQNNEPHDIFWTVSGYTYALSLQDYSYDFDQE